MASEASAITSAAVCLHKQLTLLLLFVRLALSGFSLSPFLRAFFDELDLPLLVVGELLHSPAREDVRYDVWRQPVLLHPLLPHGARQPARQQRDGVIPGANTDSDKRQDKSLHYACIPI